MRLRHRRALSGGLAIAAMLAVGHAQPMARAGLARSAGAASAQTGPQSRALLVGVTGFLDKQMTRYALQGPGNDVELLKQVLEGEPFRMPSANIATLTGLPANAALRPTRTNIERAFQRLRDVSKPGDQVVVFMAGHGSQQPADLTDPTNFEADGFDEIFLPADAAGWDDVRGQVRNVIVDNDVRRWVTEIRNKGAFVWIVFDACQSGTMTRGAPVSVERDRQVPMRELVPQSAIDAARGRAARDRAAPGRKDTPLALNDSPGDIAALYAANMSETTPERPLPNADSPVHGLFSYTIADVLVQSSTALTYRELAQRVLERYRGSQRFAPTPMFEGGGLDREVLGQRTWPDRPSMLLGTPSSSTEWRLGAGSIHGLTIGSILELFPPAGARDADKPVGHLRVTSVAPTSAEVSPAPFAGVAAPSATALAPGSRARVASYNFGDLRLKVAVQQRDASRGANTADEYGIVAPGAGVRALEQALADLPARTNGLAERVSSADADWFVRVVDARVVLVPASGWQPTSAPVGPAGTIATPPQFRVGDVNEPALGQSLGDALRRIARARNLLRMTTHPGSGARLDLHVTRYDTETATAGRPLYAGAGDVSVKAGEWLEFRVKNSGEDPLDVTLLYVDAGFGITPLFPPRDRDIDNRLAAGEERALGRFPITDDPLGWESTVAIGVESTMARQNFAMLAQDSLPLARSLSSRPVSPLQALLDDAMFGRGGTRSPPPMQDLGKFVVTLATWRTERAGK